MGKMFAYLGAATSACLALDIKSDTGTYLETGVHKGRSMIFFADNLITKVKKLHLIGYDVFDLETDNFHLQEDNGMLGGDFNECFNTLTQLATSNPNISFDLVKGYTKDTLKSTKVDWAYIDGGHSYETVKWDHEQLKDSRVIVFDDADLPGVNRYLWEIKNQYNIYSLCVAAKSSEHADHRQAIIINDMDNFKFDDVSLEKFQGHDPRTYVSLRKV
jgi:hypothetical protein